MPLISGSSPGIVSHNIREMVRAGHPHKVAVAAALHNAHSSGGIRPIHRDDGGFIPSDPSLRSTLNTAAPMFSSPSIQPPQMQRGLGPPKAPQQVSPGVMAPDPFSSAPHLDAGGIPTGAEMGPWFMRREAADMTHDSGPLISKVPGRTDQLNKMVPAGSYVVPADVVSGLGEGNTLAGASFLSRALGEGPHGTPMPRIAHGKGVPNAPHMSANMQSFAKGGSAEGGGHVPVVLAGGEYVVHPESVKRIGGGDIKRGHRILDHFVLHARKQTIKQMKKLKGPKK